MYSKKQTEGNLPKDSQSNSQPALSREPAETARPSGPPTMSHEQLLRLKDHLDQVQAHGSASLIATGVRGLWMDYQKNRDLPEKARSEVLARSMEKAQQTFADADLSPELTQQAHAALTETMGQLSVHAKYDDIMRRARQYGQFMTDDMESAVEAGDYTRAGSLIDLMVSSGFQSEKQGAEMRRRMEDTRAYSEFQQGLSRDPFGTLKAMDERVASDPSARNFQWRAAARQTAAQVRTTQYAGLMQDLADGNVRDFADLEARYPHVDRSDHEALDRAMKRDVPNDPGVAADVLFGLYDHAADPDGDRNSEEWNKALFDVGTKLTGRSQKHALDLVQQIQSDKGIDSRVLTAVSSLGETYRRGVFGTAGGATALTLLNKLVSYSKNNPDANEDKLNAYASSIRAPYVSQAAANTFRDMGQAYSGQPFDGALKIS